MSPMSAFAMLDMEGHTVRQVSHVCLREVTECTSDHTHASH